ncbi:MAG: PAS domain-containing sensor histidine kinase [Acidimicrobiia bacterium]|nr:PAS domain-containing sensor histidine kinase [Acidimicrobiia bacterium]
MNGQLSTEFEPAERASLDEVRRQSAKLLGDPMMRSVADSSKAYISVLNSDRQIVFANRAMVEAFGQDLDQAIGSRPGELIGCRRAVAAEGGCGTTKFCSTCGSAIAIRASRTVGSNEEECRILRETGDPIDLRVTAAPMTVDGEQFTLFTAVDIGDAKRRRTLERIFFHDVMNTATGVQGLSSMVRVVDGGEREEILGLLEMASNHLIDEIQAQRELLAAETNDLAVRIEPVNSNRLLNEIARVYEAHDVGIGKSVELNGASHSVLFLSDPTLLGRVVGNLVKNALEATASGETVTLKCEQADGRISFSVHNQAVIPAEAQLQIFQRSFTTKGEGRGLGTYGSRLITERYLDGNIAFESSEGSGTTFTVEYPFVTSNDAG